MGYGEHSKKTTTSAIRSSLLQQHNEIPMGQLLVKQLTGVRTGKLLKVFYQMVGIVIVTGVGNIDPGARWVGLA